VHRIERPATGSYAPAPVEIKQKATRYLGEKSVSGKGVNRDSGVSVPNKISHSWHSGNQRPQGMPHPQLLQSNSLFGTQRFLFGHHSCPDGHSGVAAHDGCGAHSQSQTISPNGTSFIDRDERRQLQ
jgi:hypothetical protein